MWNENEKEEMNVAVDSNEIAQNGLEEQNTSNIPSENQISESKPKNDGKKNLFIVLGVLILLLVVCIAFAVCGGNSKGMKFVKLLTEDQLFIEMLEDKGKYEQVDLKIKVDLDDIARETNSDELNLGKLTLNATLNEKDEDFSAKANVSVSKLNIKIPEVQIMKTGDLIGLINSDDQLAKGALLAVDRTYSATRADVIYGNTIINDVAKSIGIKDKIGTHTLRKTFGYHAYNNGYDITLIQKLFNHSTPAITLRYIGITQEELDDVYLSLDL